MSCPFRHLWPKGTGEPTAAAEAAAAAPPPAAAGHTHGAAPADADQLGAPPPATPTSSTGGPAADQAAPAEARCPFLAGVGGVALSSTTAAAGAADAAQPPAQAQQQQQQAEEAGASDAPPATCPLGFGSGRQPKLGQFHCMLCKSLYHDCVLTSCGHRFCGGCIKGARDCPACGADIESMQPDAEMQAMVDKYIDAHAATHTIWELEGSAGQRVDGMAGERSRASFLLQLGLRAIAAGNTDSARHRFQLCRQDLQQQLDSAVAAKAAPAELAPLQCRLGAVCGCLGDCCRAEGDAAGTLRYYQDSVALLREAGQDPEAQQALSVALNKLGELHHLQGDLASAAELYGQALQLRRQLLAATRQQWQQAGGEAPAAAAQGSGSAGGAGSQPAAGGEREGEEACCSAALDLAASCLKLAGARRGLGADADAEALLAEGAALLQELQGGLAVQPPLLQRKHAVLAQHAAMLGQGPRG